LGWNHDEIAREWLADSVIAVPPDQVVAAFDRCELLLGREWIFESRGSVVGALPTLRVVTMGQRLASLDGLRGAETLIEKLAKGDSSAAAELHSIDLLRSVGNTSVELFPTVVVGSRKREPDFRIRCDQNDPWVHVEVTRPDMAEAHEQAKEICDKLSAAIDSVDRSFDLEVFLRREPADAEVGAVLTAIETLCSTTESGRSELPNGLGLLLLGSTPTGPITPADHGEEVRPRLGQARIKVEPGVARRIVVRLPYSDDRAEKFLHREAAQLPTDGPGMLMVHMGNTPGGFRTWEPLIRRRFQPAVHTRVGGVCLFSSGTLLTEAGFAVLSQTKLIANPHARSPLPHWIESTIACYGAEYQSVSAKHLAAAQPGSRARSGGVDGDP
jgi:hypothetical protein